VDLSTVATRSTSLFDVTRLRHRPINLTVDATVMMATPLLASPLRSTERHWHCHCEHHCEHNWRRHFGHHYHCNRPHNDCSCLVVLSSHVPLHPDPFRLMLPTTSSQRTRKKVMCGIDSTHDFFPGSFTTSRQTVASSLLPLTSTEHPMRDGDSLCSWPRQQ
jgi:hypothetical protein